MEAAQLQEYDDWIADNLGYLVEHYTTRVKRWLFTTET